jgi:hypothetical protein
VAVAAGSRLGPWCFLFNTVPEQASAVPITVVLDWEAEVRKEMPLPSGSASVPARSSRHRETCDRVIFDRVIG